MACVSVVIPVYNIAQHLRQCMDSVLGQTMRDIEVICVDDGSTDESPAILAWYVAQDNRVQVITQKNAGPGAARNTGMARATSEYLIFLDSDDWFEPDFLEQMVKKAKKIQADIIICRSVSFDTNTGKEIQSDWMLNTAVLKSEVFIASDVSDHIFQITHGWPWDKLYRREFVLREGFQFPDLRNSQDMVFVYPSLLRAEKIALVESVLIHHRFHRKASVSNTRADYLTAPYDAVCMVKLYMEKWEILKQYEVSYLNWIVGFLVWHISSIKDAEVQKVLLHKLRKEWIPVLGLRKYPISFYRGLVTKVRLLLAIYAPEWLFYGVSSGYNILKHYIQQVR